MRGIPVSVCGRACSLVLSFVLAAGPALQAGPVFASEGAESTATSTGANALDASVPTSQSAEIPEATETSAHASAPGAAEEAEPTQEPTVIRELEELRTETATHYELSDGTTRAEISVAPIRFEDDGEWRPIATDLVPGAGFGEYVTASTSMTASFAPQLPGQTPVTLEGDGFEVGVDYRGAAEQAKVVYGDTTRYLDVAEETDLEYQALRSGVKETLVLKSAGASTAHTFDVALDGVEIRRDPLGTYGLYRPGESSPELVVGDLIVFDSSRNAGDEPEYCAETTMTIEATADGAQMTYEVSPEWLSDPDRVFPVQVDPTFSVSLDTFITSAFPSTTYHTNVELKCGYYSGAGHNRSYVRFDTTSIPAGVYISNAEFKIRQQHTYSSGTTRTYLGRLNSSFSTGTTWNTQSSVAGDPYAKADMRRGQDVGPGIRWVYWDVHDIVKTWVDGPSSNRGFFLYQQENSAENTTNWRKFHSNELSNSEYRPKLTVDYSGPGLSFPATKVDKTVYRVGDVVTATIRMGTGIPEDVNCLRMTVKGWDGVPSQQVRGEFQWTETAPSAGWLGATTNLPGTGGGYVSSRSSVGVDLLETQCVENVANDSSSPNDFAEVTFKWLLTGSYGNVQDNDIEVVVMMNPVNGNDVGKKKDSR